MSLSEQPPARAPSQSKISIGFMAPSVDQSAVPIPTPNHTKCIKPRSRWKEFHPSSWLLPSLKLTAGAITLVALAWVGARASPNPFHSSTMEALSPSASASDSPALALSTGVGQPFPMGSPSVSAEPTPFATSGAPSSATLADGRIVLNTAEEGDLRRLPGIGPKRAKAILDLRKHIGKFHAISDLLRIKGFGRRALERIRPLLLIDPPTDAPSQLAP